MSLRTDNAQANVRLAFSKQEWEDLMKSEEFIAAWTAAHDKTTARDAVELGTRILFRHRKWNSGQP